MASVENELTCFFNMSKTTDLLSCFVTSSGLPVWNIIYLGVLIIAVGGWASFRSINEAMMIGGFLTNLVGLALIALELLSVKIYMLGVLVMIVGIVITVIKRNDND